MKLASDGKIDADGVISSSEMMTEKKAMEQCYICLKHIGKRLVQMT